MDERYFACVQNYKNVLVKRMEKKKKKKDIKYNK